MEQEQINYESLFEKYDFIIKEKKQFAKKIETLGWILFIRKECEGKLELLEKYLEIMCNKSDSTNKRIKAESRKIYRMLKEKNLLHG